MKKATISLLIISVIALIFMLLLRYAWLDDGNRRADFILEWFLIILLPLLFPLIGKSITIHLAIEKPRTWLLIHGGAVLIWIFVQIFAFSFIEKTMDLSLCINRNFSTATITVQSVSSDKKTQTIKTNRDTFELKRNDFNSVIQSETYQIIYLPNSMYVIDIIDEDGKSIRK